MNLDRIQGVMEFIEFEMHHDDAPVEDDHTFDMCTWTNVTPLGWDFNKCGTSMCIGGSAIHLYGTDVQKDQLRHEDGGVYEPPSTIAGKILDLEYQQGQDLFYYTGPNVELTPEVAIRTLQHLIDTGEVVWQTD